MRILINDGQWNTREGWARDSFDYSQEGGYSIEEQLARMEEYDPERHLLFGDGHVELFGEVMLK